MFFAHVTLTDDWENEVTYERAYFLDKGLPEGIIAQCKADVITWMQQAIDDGWTPFTRHIVAIRVTPFTVPCQINMKEKSENGDLDDASTFYASSDEVRRWLGIEE